MADKRASAGVVSGRAVRVSKDAVRAMQAGLGAWALLFLTFSTFGPWFNVGVATFLVLGGLLLGLVSVFLADRGYHSTLRDPRSRGIGHATFAFLVGLPAVAVGGGYLGLHLILLLLFPLGLYVFVVTGVVGVTALLARTSARARGESFFRAWFDAPSQTSACGCCGRRTGLAAGQWIWNGWLCPACHTYFAGGSA